MKMIDYRKIEQALNADVRAAFAKHGLKMDRIRASLDETLGVVRYSIQTSDANAKDSTGQATSPEREFYKQMAGLYDLKPEWLGQTFTSGRGQEYRVVGLRTGRAEKCVCIVRLPDNKPFVTTAESVVLAFAAKAAKPVGPVQQAAAR